MCLHTKLYMNYWTKDTLSSSIVTRQLCEIIYIFCLSIIKKIFKKHSPYAQNLLQVSLLTQSSEQSLAALILYKTQVMSNQRLKQLLLVEDIEWHWEWLQGLFRYRASKHNAVIRLQSLIEFICQSLYIV